MTTKNKRQPATSTETRTAITSKRVENSWIMLLKDSLFENVSFSIVTLPHPGHDQPAKYCIDQVNHKLYEVVTFSEPYRSWFIGETVRSDGSFQILTPVNPLFIVLPKLREQCATRAIPLQDLLSDKGFEKIYECVTNMDKIADLKGSAEMQAYKYNEDKTIIWLEDRVRKLAKVLREKNIHVSSGAVSATFVTSNVNNQSMDEELYLKYAHGIISEYLQDDVIELLNKKFDFKPDLVESLAKKRMSEADQNEVNKKIKLESSEDSTSKILNGSFTNTESKKPKPLTTKEKARQKAASGSKTLSAFFVKK